MKLPPDIDRLAWSVAESDDPRLRAEFAERYPEHVEEMERRAALVDERGHHPAHAETGIALPERRMPVPMWATVLAGLAVGGVVVAALLPRRAVDATGEPVVAAPRTATTNAVVTGDEPVVNMANTPGGPQDIPPVSTATPSPNAGSPRPTSLRLEGTALHDAVALIAAAGSFSARFDPAIPDPEVRQNFADLTPREMLDRLGSEYGFRIVEEAPGSLVLVPLGELPEGGESAPGETGTGSPAADAGGGTIDPRANPTNNAGNSPTDDFPVFADGNR